MVSDPLALRGLGFTADGGFAPAGAPAILEFTRPDFVGRYLTDLGAAPGPSGGPSLVELSQARVDLTAGGTLYQPVHRTFYLVSLGAICDTYGSPRLDRAKIDSAGIVVRRVASDGRHERWSTIAGVTRWVECRDDYDEDADPDATRRPNRYRSGNAVVDASLLAARGGDTLGSERVTKAFVGAQTLCATVGHTVLFAPLQLASSEVEGTAPGASPPAYTDAELDNVQMLPVFFAASTSISLGPMATRTYGSDDVRRLSTNSTTPPPIPDSEAQERNAFDQFVQMLRQLVSEFDAFNDSDFTTALDGVTLSYADGTTRGAGDALSEAATLFIQGQSSVTVVMPRAWPVLSAAQAGAIRRAALAAANRRLASLLPMQGRFDVPNATYVVRAFMRVKRDDGCPPTLVWSDCTPAFSIAPWHAAGKLPPVQIQLPNVTPDNARSFLPNVAFNVPPGILNLLNANKPKAFLDGSAAASGSTGIGWICGFNIPILTLCAFIVLNIFLSLLNIVFWWMAFIKICIPVPASLKDKLPNGSVN